MREKNKSWMKIAACLLAAGLLLFVGAMTALGFDFARLSTVRYETNTYEISEAFSQISIDAATTDIEFALSENDQCKIVFYEKETVKHSAIVQDGTLTIRSHDTRKWYDHIGFFFDEAKMTVYLPRAEYAALLIKGSTGDIKIPKDFAFATIGISASTGNVECAASAPERMKIQLSTGNIRVENASVGTLDLSTTTGGVTVSSVSCKGDMQVSVSTGKAKLTDVTCKGVISNGSTGDIILKNVLATENFSIERSTGDVLFDGSDAAEIYVKTSTGDVTGTLLSQKAFETKTNTGRVRVPKSGTGGKCQIKTSTGDIQIDIQK